MYHYRGFICEQTGIVYLLKCLFSTVPTVNVLSMCLNLPVSKKVMYKQFDVFARFMRKGFVGSRICTRDPICDEFRIKFAKTLEDIIPYRVLTK
jgi:hypothetical protein